MTVTLVNWLELLYKKTSYYIVNWLFNRMCIALKYNSNVILYFTVPYKGNNTVIMTTHKTAGVTAPPTPQVTSPTAHVTPPDAHTGEPVRQTTTSLPVLPTGAGK